MITYRGQAFADGDKFIVLEIPGKTVTISYDVPYVTIEHFHFETVEIDDEKIERKVTDAFKKVEMPFWNAVIQETSELEKIEKVRKA